MAKSGPVVVDDPIIGDNVVFYPNGRFSHEKFALATVMGGMNGVLNLSLRNMGDGRVIPGLKMSVHRRDSEFLQVNPQAKAAGAWETRAKHTELVEEWRTNTAQTQQESARKTRELAMRNEQALKDRRQTQEAVLMYKNNKTTEEIAAFLGRDLSWVQNAIDTSPLSRVR